jgi:hypothetical protein
MVFQLFPQFSKHSHRIHQIPQSSDGSQRYPADYPVVTAFSVVVKDNSISSLLDEDLDCEEFVEYRRNTRPVRPSVLMLAYDSLVILRQFCNVSREGP